MDERNRGFSLVEAMIVLAVAALVLLLGVPAFAAAMERNRTALALHLLMADMAMARSTAVVRGQQVVVCPRSVPDRCDTTSDWSGGWLVFLDPDGDRQPGGRSDVLRASDPPTGRGFALRSSRPFLRYQKDGRSAHSNLTVNVCRHGEVAGQVVVNNHGRARSVRPATSLPCPGG
jgi:type IV fimbrial biogenesis protein FimT